MSRTSIRSLRLLALVLLFAGVGCASVPWRPSPTRIARIVETNEVRIGMSGEQPPLNMTRRDGSLFGLEVAMGRLLAAAMGVQARFVRIPFPRLLDALESGEVDLVMSGMTITPKRNLRASFVGPYYVSGKSVLARSDTFASVQKAAELNRPSFRFAALAGSTSEIFVSALMPQATLVLTETLEDAIGRLLAGEVDALVADREVTGYAMLRYYDQGLRAIATPLTVEPIGIALPADDPALVNLVQNYLRALEMSGALEEARRYWLEDPIWVEELR